MSQLVLLQKFVPKVKLQSVVDRCNDRLYQCWSNIHELLFWIASVIINHWRLKEENSNTMVMDDNFIFGTHNSTPVNEQPSLPTTKHKILKAKVPLTIETKPTAKKEKKMIVKKQSLFLVKNHVLSWKQKFSSRSPYEPVSPIVKRLFLRRLSSGNNVIYSDTNTASSSSSSSSSSMSSSKSEPSSPTVSILKSISFKLKRQDIMSEEVMPVVIESNSTRSSRLFKRKTSMDTLN